MDLTEDLVATLARDILGTLQITYQEYPIDLTPLATGDHA
jgi:lysyl-tRNA synthetase class 2